MESNARAYHESLLAIRRRLGLELEEIDDWNCCGATEYLAVHRVGRVRADRPQPGAGQQQANGTRQPSLAAVQRLLPQPGQDRLLHARGPPTRRRSVNEALAAGGLHYEPGSSEGAPPARRDLQRHRLRGGQGQGGAAAEGPAVAPYYGCMVARPDYDSALGQPRISHRAGSSCLQVAGRRGGRLSAEDALLRRAHDADRPGDGLRADPPAGARRRAMPAPT